MHEKRTCSIEGCDRPSRKRGWCVFHYDRWRANGDPLIVLRRRFSSDEDRLAQYDIDPITGCWVWNGLRHRQGYGYTTVNGVPTLAHRATWESANGPIPEGMAVCHTCDNPPCIFVQHLFLGTHTDNMRDMVAKGRNVTTFVPADTCKNGHPWTKETEYFAPATGKRRCRKCSNEASIAYYYSHKP